jgi:hypothetical protein
VVSKGVYGAHSTYRCESEGKATLRVAKLDRGMLKTIAKKPIRIKDKCGLKGALILPTLLAEAAIQGMQ